MTAGVDLSVKTNRHGLLDQKTLDLTAPIMSSLTAMARQIRDRASNGRAAHALFHRYGSTRAKKDPDSLFWVPPSQPQPEGPGFVIRLTERLVGWAGYTTYNAYLRLIGKGGPHTFSETGQMWAGLRLWQRSPKAFRLSFTGKRTPRKGAGGPNALRSNVRLARILNSRESSPILAASQAEIDEFVEALVVDIEGLSDAETSFATKKRLATLQRRGKKLNKLRTSGFAEITKKPRRRKRR